MKPKPVKPTPLLVEIIEAKPNPLFTEAQRQLIRFLRFNQYVPCAACGKKVKVPWTHLTEFKAGDMDGSMFKLRFYPQVFPPLTPVCGDHPLGLPRKRRIQEVRLWPYNEKASEWHRLYTQCLYFRYPQPCAACKRRTKKHWTMFCPFQVEGSDTVHPPLTVVCFHHSLRPAR